MSFPSTEEYSNVLNMPPGTRPFRVGNPTLDNIRQGTVEGGKHYLHRDVGQYAAVYRFFKPSGEAVALRCLLQVPPVDVHFRSTEQQAYLQLHPLPYFVEAGYHEDALLVGGDWYPVFTMTWVQGETLHSYVQRLCAAKMKHSLAELASRWEKMLTDLRQASIAHGDLHPLNALVQNDGQIKLVDYDTLFVPALKLHSAVLSGCEGYVHPSYLSGTPRPFDETIDVFGGAVVLLSLRVLADDPTIFGRFSKDNLLFTGEDLSQPDRSNLFDLLERNSKPNISNLAAALREECRQPLETGVLTLDTLKPFKPRPGIVPDLTPKPRQIRRGLSGL